MAGEMFINSIPQEVLLNIFSMIPNEYLVTNLQYVCKHWMAVSRNWRLWKNFVYAPDENVPHYAIIDFLKQAPALKMFSLAGSRVTDLLIGALTKYCPDLRKVKLISHVCLTRTQIDNILTGLPLLEHLHLNLNIECDTKAIALIMQCPSLKNLDIGRQTIKDRASKLEWKFRKDDVNSLENVTVTYKKGQNLSVGTLTYLMDFKKDTLISLSVGIPKLNQQYANQIGRCSKLNSLHICITGIGNVNLMDLEDMTWLNNFSALKHLSLNNFADGIDKILCAHSWHHLVKLNLNLSTIEEFTAGAIVERCPNLTHLSLSMTNMAPRNLRDVHKLLSLEDINLERSYRVTNETVKDIARCPKLSSVNLNGCRRLTEEAVTFLLQCRYLKVLRICCPRVAAHHFKVIPYHLPRLEVLQVWVNSMTEQHFYNLLAKLPKLRVEL